MANEYGKLTAKFYDPVLGPFIKGIRKRVALEIKRLGARRIIDLCCGTGHQLYYLKDKGFEQVVGVDLSEAMVQVSKRYGVNCQVGDASKTKFGDNSFDLAMVSFALHEKPWNLAQGIVNEAKRIVRPGGHFLVVDYYYDRTTGSWGRFITWLIEFLVGGEHYRNYRNFIRQGGLDKMCQDLPVVKKIRILSRSIAITIYAIEK